MLEDSHRFERGALDGTLQTNESGCQPVELINRLQPLRLLSVSQHPYGGHASDHTSNLQLPSWAYVF